jgi:alpha-tubulin suppressor-like RCC1 family protein
MQTARSILNSIAAMTAVACLGCSSMPESPGAVALATVSAGGMFACGTTRDGAAYCWGANESYELGNGTVVNSSGPVAVVTGLPFSSVSAGGSHACGLTEEGVAYCWGENDEGQVGDGTLLNRGTPVAVTGGLTFGQISAGGAHTCGITVQGVAYCWGFNGNEQLGAGDTLSGINHSAPLPVVGGLTFTSISAGAVNTCGVTASGSAYCWGDNSQCRHQPFHLPWPRRTEPQCGQKCGQLGDTPADADGTSRTASDEKFKRQQMLRDQRGLARISTDTHLAR